eukprot:1159668-Pelagomonas_calceolata.AAC.8
MHGTGNCVEDRQTWPGKQAQLRTTEEGQGSGFANTLRCVVDGEDMNRQFLPQMLPQLLRPYLLAVLEAALPHMPSPAATQRDVECVAAVWDVGQRQDLMLGIIILSTIALGT